MNDRQEGHISQVLNFGGGDKRREENGNRKGKEGQWGENGEEGMCERVGNERGGNDMGRKERGGRRGLKEGERENDGEQKAEENVRKEERREGEGRKREEERRGKEKGRGTIRSQGLLFMSRGSGVNGCRILAGTRWPNRKYVTDAHRA